MFGVSSLYLCNLTLQTLATVYYNSTKEEDSALQNYEMENLTNTIDYEPQLYGAYSQFVEVY